jgi:hypothetical protein
VKSFWQLVDVPERRFSVGLWTPGNSVQRQGLMLLLSLLLSLPVIGHAQAQETADVLLQQAEARGLPHFSVAAPALDLTLLGVLQAAKAGHRTRELLLYPVRNPAAAHATAQTETAPLEIAVALNELSYPARANDAGGYGVMFPLSPANEKVISGLSSLGGSITLRISLQQAGLSETVMAKLDLDPVAAVEAAADKPRRGPSLDIWLGGLTTLVLFLLSAWQAWREHKHKRRGKVK